MNERILAAKALRDQGLAYSDIGDVLGVSRQRAYTMTKQAERLAAFNNVNAPVPPKGNGDLMAEPYMPPEGSKPAGIIGTRQSYDLESAGSWTMAKLVSVMEQLRQGYDPYTYFSLAEEMLERDPEIRSLMDIRVSQTSSQPFVPDVDGRLLREKKATEAGLEMLNGAGLADAVPLALWARHYSVQVFELEWEQTPTAKTIKKIHWRDARSFAFDRQDPRKLYIKSDVPGGALVEAPAGRFVAVFANGKPGQPVRGGLAVPGAWLYVKSQITDYDWTKFLNRYGKATPTISFPDTMKPTPAEVAEARRTASQVGSDTALVLQGGVTLDFKKDSTVTGSSDAHERKLRYEGELKAKLYLGSTLANGTSNTGGGGSLALGNVHAELRYDLQKADAALAEALANEALYWHAVFNSGTDAFIPKVKMQLDEPVDVQAIASNAKVAAEIGLPLSKTRLAQMLGLPLAETPEDAIQMPSAAPAAGPGFTATPCPEHSPKAFAASGAPRDAIDDLADAMLADYEKATKSTDDVLAELVLSAGSVEAACAALLEHVNTGDVSKLQALFTTNRTATHAAGKLGGEV